jgi:hypothetical protein
VSALSAQTAEERTALAVSCRDAGKEVERTVAEETEEDGVLLDRLLHAENADSAKLVVENPLAERRLDDVGAVKAGREGMGIVRLRRGEEQGKTTNQSMQLVRTTEVCFC